jgi:hypothetical protein
MPDQSRGGGFGVEILTEPWQTSCNLTSNLMRLLTINTNVIVKLSSHGVPCQLGVGEFIRHFSGTMNEKL